MVSEQEIQRLIGDLQSPDFWERLDAFRTLEKIGLDKLDINTRIYCLLRFEKIEDIVKLGEEALETLVQILIDFGPYGRKSIQDYDFMENAVVAIKKIGGLEALKALIMLLDDVDDVIEERIVQSLEEISEKIELKKIQKTIQEYVSEESGKGEKPGRTARKNGTKALMVIMKKLGEGREKVLEGKLSNGIPKPLASAKTRLLRQRRAIR